MEKSLVDQYRAKFEELKKQVEFMRSLLRESGLLDSAIDTSKIDELRDKLLTAFDKEKIAKEHSGPNACHCCHYASAPNQSPLRIYDIAYLLIKNSDFQLPEPDWQAIKKNNPSSNYMRSNGINYYKCLFLGPRGCLYGENRPAVCLSYVCHGAIKAILEKPSELRLPSMDYPSMDNIGNLVLEKIGFPGDFMMGVVVSDWFYKIIVPKIGKSEKEIISAFNQA